MLNHSTEGEKKAANRVLMDLKLTQRATRCEKEPVALELVAILTHANEILEHRVSKLRAPFSKEAIFSIISLQQKVTSSLFLLFLRGPNDKPD